MPATSGSRWNWAGDPADEVEVVGQGQLVVLQVLGLQHVLEPDGGGRPDRGPADVGVQVGGGDAAVDGPGQQRPGEAAVLPESIDPSSSTVPGSSSTCSIRRAVAVGHGRIPQQVVGQRVIGRGGGADVVVHAEDDAGLALALPWAGPGHDVGHRDHVDAALGGRPGPAVVADDQVDLGGLLQHQLHGVGVVGVVQAGPRGQHRPAGVDDAPLVLVEAEGEAVTGPRHLGPGLAGGHGQLLVGARACRSGGRWRTARARRPRPPWPGARPPGRFVQQRLGLDPAGAVERLAGGVGPAELAGDLGQDLALGVAVHARQPEAVVGVAGGDQVGLAEHVPDRRLHRPGDPPSPGDGRARRGRGRSACWRSGRSWVGLHGSEQRRSDGQAVQGEQVAPGHLDGAAELASTRERCRCAGPPPRRPSPGRGSPRTAGYLLQVGPGEPLGQLGLDHLGQ